MKVIKLLLWLFSVLYLAILCISWTSPYWPPTVWWLANLFQMAPLWVFCFPAGFLFIVGLLVKERGVIVVHILSFVIIVFCIMRFNLSFSLLRQKDEQPQDRLRIMTCNLGNDADIRLLSDFISSTQPDIIALQEVYNHNQNALKAMLSQDKWDLKFQEDLGLASRLKIKNVSIQNRRVLGKSGVLVIKYELEGIMGGIHFFNVHLETPRTGIEAIMDNGLGGLSEIRRVAELQGKESAIASQWIASHNAVLIAGDFNMSDMNPIYKKYWSLFTNAFSRAGFGFGYTKYTSWHGVRIDHLLCDGDWRVIHSWVGPNIGSDHRSVIADIEFIGIGTEQSRSEELQEQAVPDSKILIFENFEKSLGKFENYGVANIFIDTQTTYLHGNSLKVERKTASDCISAGVKLDFWQLENYPIISFAYMIPEGTPLGIRIKTIYNDWIGLGGTTMNQCQNAKIKNEFHLIDDGEWHQIYIDVQSAVKSVLPALKYLIEFQFYIDENKHRKGIFWIDDFKIFQKDD